MSAIVAVETLLLVVLVVLVAGLLRSHAEILRRLASVESGEDLPVQAPAPTAPARSGDQLHAPDVAGTTPTGDVVHLSFSGADSSPTLLAFLTSGCSTCAGFWESLSEPRLPAGVQTVIVAHGPERERPARLRELAPPRVPVVMSSPAWSDYRVPGSPYFVLVDGEIRGEGVATTWQALSSLVRDAIDDAAESGPGGVVRARRVEETLAAAGIDAEHPSLYPAGRPEAR